MKINSQRALQVYLDSSDFSILSQRANASSDLSAILKQLESWKLAGRIELRFSFAHITEAAPTAVEYLPSATSRLALIQRLCWPHAVAAPTDVIEADAARLVSQQIEHQSIFRNDGDWLPKGIDALTLPSREDLVRGAIDDMHLGRLQRRAVERRCFGRTERLTQEGERLFSRSTGAFLDKMHQEYPLTLESAAAMRRYLAGQVSGDVALRAVLRSIRDLTVFASWLRTKWDGVSKTTTWLRESGDRPRQSMSGVAAQNAQLWSDQVAAGLTEQRIIEIRDRAFDDVRRGFVYRWARAHVQQAGESSERAPADDTAAIAPSLSVASAVMFEIAQAVCFPRTSPRAAKISDAGDLVHCLYLPHIDVFRADAFIADMIKKSVPQLSERVVSNLRELPDHIAARLS